MQVLNVEAFEKRVVYNVAKDAPRVRHRRTPEPC
jgi:hypothetical protein